MSDSALPGRRLTVPGKITFGLGELTLSVSMTALTMVYAGYFLTQEAGLRPVLAGLVPLIGRIVDAVTDPMMGRISDRTRWRSGRRRPYLLLGAIPYGVTFAALWQTPPFESQAALFCYFAAVYSLFSLSITILYVPYCALAPEMARDYDERSSLTVYRTAVASFGMAGAIGMRPLAEWIGGGDADFATTALIYSLFLTLPWLAVHRVSFEPPPSERLLAAVPAPAWSELRDLARQRSFAMLCGIYLLGRMAMDLAGALLILYATFWLGRSDDFELVMALFFPSILFSYPLALALARRYDKATVYAIGAVLWAAVSCAQFLVQPEWPRWIFFALVPLIGPGFAIVDVMPWSMIGEVADEGELESGERRDGLYNGVFSFVRKSAGALGVALILAALDLAGFQKSSGAQSEVARQAIRAISAFAPAVPLLLGIWLARNYPLTRSVHARIRAALDARAPSALPTQR